FDVAAAPRYLARIERKIRDSLNRGARAGSVIDLSIGRDAGIFGAEAAPLAFVDVAERARHDQGSPVRLRPRSVRHHRILPGSAQAVAQRQRRAATLVLNCRRIAFPPRPAM